MLFLFFIFALAYSCLEAADALKFPFFTLSGHSKSEQAQAQAVATYADFKNRFAFKTGPRPNPNNAKTASILSKILTAVEASPNKKYSTSSSTFPSLTGASSPSGFISLASYTTPTCNASTAFVFAGLSLSQCVNDLKSGNSFTFKCNDNFIIMQNFSDLSCKALFSTSTFPSDFSTCHPYEKYLSGFELTCHPSKENIPVPMGTIIDAVFDDSSCESSGVLGYLGLPGGQQCLDLSDLCDSAVADNPSFQDVCDQVEEYGDSVSVQFSCSLNTPSAVFYLGSKACVKEGLFPPIDEPLDTDCEPVDSTKGSLFMCKTDSDDDTATPESSGSSPASTAASTGAIVGGTVQ